LLLADEVLDEVLDVAATAVTEESGRLPFAR
jgi:hypothetical protein